MSQSTSSCKINVHIDSTRPQFITWNVSLNVHNLNQTVWVFFYLLQSWQAVCGVAEVRFAVRIAFSISRVSAM